MIREMERNGPIQETCKKWNQPNSLTDRKYSMREEESHLISVLWLEASSGIPKDGKERSSLSFG